MSISRAFPAFGIGFAAFYAPAFQYNWPMFTYFPALNTFHWGLVAMNEESGPPMFWYGWVAYAVLVGLALSVITLLLPQRITDPVLAVLCWLVPLGAIAFIGYESRGWFV
jgi:hypothetical protein